MHKIYHILAVIGALIWGGAILLRGTAVMDNLIARQIIWAAPNFGAAWAAVGLAIVSCPHIFKIDFPIKKYFLPLTGVVFGLLLISELVHVLFLKATFDIWDILASFIALIILSLVHVGQGKVKR